MSQGEIASLHATIGADISGLTTGLQQAEQQLSGWGSRLNRWGSQLQGAGAALSLGVGVPLGAFVRRTLMVAGDFEEQMNILNLAARQDAEAFGVLDDAAIKIGQDVRLVGINNIMAADAMTTLYKSGYNTADIFGDLNSYLGDTAELGGMLRASIDLAAASDIDLAQASDLVSTALKSFELNSEDATMAADAFVKSADMSKAEVSDLAQSVTMFFPVAHQLGMSLEDALTYLAMLSDKGMEGAEAGTALRSMFGMMQRETDKSAEAWEDIGERIGQASYSIYDSAGNLKELPELFTDIQRAMWDPRTTDQERERWTKDIFSQYGRIAAQMIMPGQGHEWEQYQQKFEDAATATEVATVRTQGLKAAVDNLNGAIETFMTRAGTPFIQTFLTPLVDVATNVVNVLSGLPVEVLATLTSVVGALMAAGPALVALGTTLKVIAFLGAPVVLAGAAIAAVATAVFLLCDAGRAFEKSLWQWDEAIFKLFGAGALDKWIKFRKGLDEVAGAIRDLPSGKPFAAWLDIQPGASVEETWRRIGQTVWERITEGAEHVASGAWLAGLLDADIGRTAGETWANIGGALWERLTAGLPIVVGGFVGRMLGVDIDATQASTWSALGSTVWGHVREGLHATWQGVGNWVADLLRIPETEGDQAGWDEVGVWLRDKVQGVLARYLPSIDWGAVFAAGEGGGMGGFVTALGQGILDALRQVDWVQSLNHLWGALSSGVGHALLGLMGGEQRKLEAVWQAVGRTAGEQVLAGIAYVGTFVNAGRDGLAGLLGITPEAGETGWQAIGRTAVEGVLEGMRTAGDQAAGAWQWLKDKFVELTGDLATGLSAQDVESDLAQTWLNIGGAIWRGIVDGFGRAYTGLGEIILALLGGDGGGTGKSLNSGLKVAMSGIEPMVARTFKGAAEVAGEETGEPGIWTRVGRRIWELIVQGMRDALGAVGGLGLGAGEFLLGLLGSSRAADETVYQALGRTIWEGIAKGLEAASGAASTTYTWLSGYVTGAVGYLTALLSPDEGAETPLLASLRGLGERMWAAITSGWTTVEGTEAYQAVADWISGIMTDPNVVLAINGIRGFFSAGGFLDVLFGGGEPARGTGEAAEAVLEAGEEVVGAGQSVLDWLDKSGADVQKAIGSVLSPETAQMDRITDQWHKNLQEMWRKGFRGLLEGGEATTGMVTAMSGLSGPSIVQAAGAAGLAIGWIVGEGFLTGLQELGSALGSITEESPLMHVLTGVGAGIAGAVAGAIGVQFSENVDLGKTILEGCFQSMLDAVGQVMGLANTLGLRIMEAMLEGIVNAMTPEQMASPLGQLLEAQLKTTKLQLATGKMARWRDEMAKVTGLREDYIAQGLPPEMVDAMFPLPPVPAGAADTTAPAERGEFASAHERWVYEREQRALEQSPFGAAFTRAGTSIGGLLNLLMPNVREDLLGAQYAERDFRMEHGLEEYRRQQQAAKAGFLDLLDELGAQGVMNAAVKDALIKKYGLGYYLAPELGYEMEPWASAERPGTVEPWLDIGSLFDSTVPIDSVDPNDPRLFEYNQLQKRYQMPAEGARPYQVQVPAGMTKEEFEASLTLTDDEWRAMGHQAGEAYGTGFKAGYEAAMNLNLDAFSAQLLKRMRAAGVPY